MLTERINAHLRELSDTDKCIWRCIEGNRTAASRASIHELARACAVSSASVVRFAQKLGFDGFGEMKAFMRMEGASRSLPERDVITSLGSFYDETWRELMRRDYTRASCLIREAHRVFAYASGYVQTNVMQEMKRLFVYDNILIYEIAGREEFYSVYQTAGKDDLFIFISLSGESERVVEFANQLSLKGVPILSITEMRHNTLASRSTENLYVMPAEFALPENEARLQFKSMLAYFLLLEIWYVHYRLYVQELSE
ncbi:RpiR family transcriptional regulator [Selenomonas sp. oral taxon 920]|uniref:MurR/RpiR family transcriptional regulator n=1 Tax=Selenomonas sp. oral taxon 920 TaxID=1884263 RepID=UPI0008409622|nr:MurR/RpiR family transcriptional regulator [Selenomonas sp. oral taxon 920]AOH48648.1 RpiR family transcriptional regulator [Selenomonas sp. oral taxon 920]